MVTLLVVSTSDILDCWHPRLRNLSFDKWTLQERELRYSTTKALIRKQHHKKTLLISSLKLKCALHQHVYLRFQNEYSQWCKKATWLANWGTAQHMGSVCASHSAVPGSILKSDRWKKSNPQSFFESHSLLNVLSVRKHLMGKIKRSSTANAGQLGLIGVNWNVSILFHQLINCHLLLISH